MKNHSTPSSNPHSDDDSVPFGAPTHVALAGIPQPSTPAAIRAAVRAAAEAATDFSWLSRGDRVFLKPALNSGHPYPATTSPLALAAMVELLLEKGAGRVLAGDMAGIEHVRLSPRRLTGSTRQLMEASGMAAALRNAGAHISLFEEDGWNAFHEELPSAGSHWRRGLMMPNLLDEVDHIVLMPRCARHALAGCTLGLKCAVGYWRTDTRLEYHYDAATFHEKTAEGNTVPSLLAKQRLVLTLADQILLRFGPDRGEILCPPTGLVIASTSLVAHDMVSLAWLLEQQRAHPVSWPAFLHDPYSTQWTVSLGNHWIVNLLGGWHPAWTSQRLRRRDLDSIWDDRALMHAGRIFGGLPRLTLQAVDRLATPLLPSLQYSPPARAA